MQSIQIQSTGRLDERESAFPQAVQLPDGDMLCSFGVGAGSSYMARPTGFARRTAGCCGCWKEPNTTAHLVAEFARIPTRDH